MTKLNQTFKELKKNKQIALMPFFTAGYPTTKIFTELIKEADRRGASVIEIGIPFSDPIADGPTIQYSSFKALQQKINLEKIFRILKGLTKEISTPLVIMSYYNPILQFGIKKFCAEAKKSGVSGLIIPDLPPGEDRLLETEAKSHGLDLIYLLAPNATPARIKLVTKHSQGFVYLVSVTGVTGSRKNLPKELISFIKRVKKQTKKPLCVGFGISSVKHVKVLRKVADGVIIGSAIVDVISGEKSTKAVKKVGSYLEKLSRSAKV